MLPRSSNGKKALWQEMLRHELLAALTRNPVVIVPVGSIEQHGPHCPQDVDISVPYHLAIRAAAAIDEFPVIVAPPISLGFTHYNMGEVGTITLSLETYIDVLCDVSRSIWANGFHRLILFLQLVVTAARQVHTRKDYEQTQCQLAHVNLRGGITRS